MRLLNRIYLVGSGAAGFDMTDPWDCHVYLIDGGSELALVDCGAGMGLEQILANIQADGFDPRRIAMVLVTHAHGDHSGGLARLQRRLGAGASASAEAASIIQAADEERSGLRLARAAGMYPADYRLEPARVDRVLAHGETFFIGDMEVTALATPGHASHSLSFLAGKALFAGDAVFHGGRVSLLNLPDSSIQDLDRTLRLLAEQPFQALLPGHLSVSVRGGPGHVQAALAKMDNLHLPPMIY